VSQVDRTGWVTVEYDGDAGARSGVRVFRTKGLEFAPGTRMQVNPEAARFILDAAPAGAMKVIEGKPADKVTRPSAQAKADAAVVEKRAGLSVLMVGAVPVAAPAPKVAAAKPLV
jgi:hypothetical protein